MSLSVSKEPNFFNKAICPKDVWSEQVVVKGSWSDTPAKTDPDTRF